MHKTNSVISLNELLLNNKSKVDCRREYKSYLFNP